jgi:Dolichyl-phosphate-mannose-protein mannosyltransferase
MEPREGTHHGTRSGALNTLWILGGVALLSVGLFLDWSRFLAIIGLPDDQLQNAWVRKEFTTILIWCSVTGTLLLVTGIVQWKYPDLADRLSNAVREVAAAIERVPVLVPLALTTLVLAKTVLQLTLYMNGYAAYGADDFTRTFSADHWLRQGGGVLHDEGFLGFAGSVWLPFPDYLFGLGLAIHRDLFFTPKFENLIISGLVVIAAFFLGRGLFGRMAGLLTAALVALQPWHVWLGISGMTSDLPSLVLITLFAAFMFRWLETDQPRSLLAAASTLGLAHGFRHESWCFAAVFSLYLVFSAVSRWRKGRLTRQWLTVVVSALAIMNAFPVLWMARTFFVQGDLMPHLSWSQWRPQQPSSVDTSGADPGSSRLGYLGIPLLAGGSFPFELALSVAGIFLVLRSDTRRSVRRYLVVLSAATLSFAVAFKGQMAASIVFVRYLLPFLVVLLPFAGSLLAQLLGGSERRRHHGVLTACVIVLAVGAFDVLRAFNYPAQFPTDAIDTGWHIRALQETSTISRTGKILIERAEDWGDLGIVALANRPERFVVLNEFGYRQRALLKESANRPAPIPMRVEDGVRGSVCESGFEVEACRDSVLREGLDMVILSSPTRVTSFQKAFQTRSWNIGRYYIFHLKPEPPSATVPFR